jgi:hypothetical protein
MRGTALAPSSKGVERVGVELWRPLARVLNGRPSWRSDSVCMVEIEKDVVRSRNRSGSCQQSRTAEMVRHKGRRRGEERVGDIHPGHAHAPVLVLHIAAAKLSCRKKPVRPWVAVLSKSWVDCPTGPRLAACGLGVRRTACSPVQWGWVQEHARAPTVLYRAELGFSSPVVWCAGVGAGGSHPRRSRSANERQKPKPGGSEPGSEESEPGIRPAEPVEPTEPATCNANAVYKAKAYPLRCSLAL